MSVAQKIMGLFPAQMCNLSNSSQRECMGIALHRAGNKGALNLTECSIHLYKNVMQICRQKCTSLQCMQNMLPKITSINLMQNVLPQIHVIKFRRHSGLVEKYNF